LNDREPERHARLSLGRSLQQQPLLEEIVGSQHDRSFSLDWPFEELTRCSLLNRIAQPQKLIYSLIAFTSCLPSRLSIAAVLIAHRTVLP
jgi:hypothetical protein